MTSSGTTDFERLARILERHLSPVNARSVLRHSLSEHKLSSAQFTLGDLPVINHALARGLRLFSTDTVSTRALRDIAALSGQSGRPAKLEPCSIDITLEADISRARTAARSMCEQTTAKGFAIQKVTTIVSELARNIVSYTSGGKVELALRPLPRERMIIRAIDQGPGIANLAHVMSGEYRSRTGLGRGIIGTKRLSDHFDISTGHGGTQIVSEVNL